MTRRAILQIGTEKTGTTTLQLFLKTNRECLKQSGFLYPRFCGDVNQTGLAAYAMNAEREDPLREIWGVRAPADVETLRSRLRKEAALELSGDFTTIFCNEHCHSRLQTAEEVGRLREFLGEFFDDIKILVYLRRQDQLALSLYTTRLKSGGTNPDILPRTNADDPFFNYDTSIALWEAAFGAENVTIRIFDRNELLGGSIVTDFLTTCGIDPVDGVLQVSNQNESILPTAQEFLRHLNEHLRPEPGVPREVLGGPLSVFLAQNFAGRGAMPSRDEALRFYDMFRPSNATLAARRFPSRPLLFSEDFSAYPETAENRALTVEDMAVLTARLYETARHEIRRLEAEIAIRDARADWARDLRSQAIERLQRASRRFATHASLFRLLAEYLLKEGAMADASVAAKRATDLNPDSSEYWHFRGFVLARTGDLAEAETSQRTALAKDPSNGAAESALRAILAARTERHNEDDLRNRADPGVG